jgi:hypothetical protein
MKSVKMELRTSGMEWMKVKEVGRRDDVTANKDDGESSFAGFWRYVYVDDTFMSSGYGFKDRQNIKKVCISTALCMQVLHITPASFPLYPHYIPTYHWSTVV